MTCMFTVKGFFFAPKPLFWLNRCCIRRQWRSRSCPAAALRRQCQRHRSSSPLHTDSRASFLFCKTHRGLTLALHSGEHHHSEASQLWQQTTPYDTHPGESVNKRSATSRNIAVFFPRPMVTAGMALCATNSPRPIGAEYEQSCGCDTVRYAVAISVSGMFPDGSAAVVIAHATVSLWDFYIRAGKLDVSATVKNTKHAESVKGVMRS